MMGERRAYIISAIMAVTLHLMVLLLFGWNIYQMQKALGSKKVSEVNAYVYQFDRVHISHENNRAINNNRRQQKQAPEPLKKNSKGVQRKLIKENVKNNKAFASHKQSSVLTRGKYNELLEQLHNAIAKAQQYPQSALILGQKGSIKIQFVLYPNGAIRDVKIISGSQFESLNQAALVAVNDIKPFTQARKYLIKAEKFQINIIFK